MNKQQEKRFSFKKIEDELIFEWNKKILLNLNIPRTKNHFLL